MNNLPQVHRPPLKPTQMEKSTTLFASRPTSPRVAARFVCVQKTLVAQLDGSLHLRMAERSLERERLLARHGVQVRRVRMAHPEKPR
jgi:hypothetical protein